MLLFESLLNASDSCAVLVFTNLLTMEILKVKRGTSCVSRCSRSSECKQCSSFPGSVEDGSLLEAEWLQITKDMG